MFSKSNKPLKKTGSKELSSSPRLSHKDNGQLKEKFAKINALMSKKLKKVTSVDTTEEDAKEIEIYKSIALDPKILFENDDALRSLTAKATDIEDYAITLFRLFEAHGKEAQLLKWAINTEVTNTVVAHDLFRGDSIATKLFYVVFFGDLGRRYLSNVIVPLIKEIMKTKHSLEVEPTKAEKGVNTEANMKWFIEASKRFLERLKESSNICPLILREAFLNLNTCVLAKFPDHTNMVGVLIFLRFFCPTLIFPLKYRLIDDSDIVHVTDKVQRALIIVSKILQSLANGVEVETARAHSTLQNEFIRKYRGQIHEFADDLIDQKMIDISKKIVASSIPSVDAGRVAHCETSMVNFINSWVIKKQDYSENSHSSLDKKYAFFMELLQSEDWKMVASSKTENVQVYSKKTEGSGLLVFKTNTVIKTTFNHITQFKFTHSASYDPRVEKHVMLERHCEELSDWHMVIHGNFPFAARDMVYTLFQTIDEDRYLEFNFSIVRPELLKYKNCVRADIIVSGAVIERNPDDPEHSVLFTEMVQVDPCGSIPAWLVNKTGADNVNSIKKLKKILKKWKPTNSKLPVAASTPSTRSSRSSSASSESSNNFVSS